LPKLQDTQRASLYFTKQGFRFLQIVRAKSFREPTIDRLEQRASRFLFTLIAPKAGETGSRTQFVDFCALSLCEPKCLVVVLLSRRLITGANKQLTSHPIDLGLLGVLIRRVD
jgi:hypothetical protein